MANLNIDDFSRERKTKQVNFRLSLVSICM